MKIKNIFAPEITEVELSETEIEFVSMLAAGVEKKKAAEILSMTYYKQRKLFDKLGLTVKRRKHYIQAVYLFAAVSFYKNDKGGNIGKSGFVFETEASS